MVREQLQSLAEAVRDEILETDSVTIDNVIYTSNKKAITPLKGMCAPAVEKFKKIVPEGFKVKSIAFTYSGETIWDRGRHVIAEVKTSEGLFEVDPTIHQYLPNAPMVYGPKDSYPLRVVPGTIYRD